MDAAVGALMVTFAGRMLMALVVEALAPLLSVTVERTV
jgi:hypothetical protein